MSAINNNAFTSGFPLLSGNAPEFASTNGNALQRSMRPNDSVGLVAQPLQVSPQAEASTPWDGASGESSDGGLSGFNAIMNGFVTALQNLLASLGQQFGFASNTGSNPGSAQQHFANASANSVGDPHETFDGTPSSGAKVDNTWDSMDSHSDLLDSDSFEGGYRESTTVTAPNEKGVTMNAQAQIALGNGATTITLNKDGSYAVSSDGEAITLQQGRAVSLSNGESVTLGADTSLTVNATNGSGGSLKTVLSVADGGVNVKNTATGIDLGGYLVTHDDRAPKAPASGYSGVSQAPTSYAYDAPADANPDDRLSTLV